MPPVSFNVTLSSPPAGGVVGGSPGVGTIYPGTVPGPSVSSVSSVSGNEGTSLVHTVTLSAATTASTDYAYSLSGGTSTSVSDYTVPPTFSNGVTLSGGTLTVPSGVSSFTVTVAALTDGLTEGSETYILHVGGVNGTGTIGDVVGGSLITPNVVVRRVSGPAPLLVHFDASGTTAASWTSRPYFELDYTWDFGDPTAGNWSRGAWAALGQSWPKNMDKGPIAAHVYETPGTYNPSCTMRYDTDTNTYYTTEIVVTNPNTVYGNANTIYVSNTLPVAGVNGVPSGATNLVASSDADAAFSAAIANGKRILFCRGDTFNLSTSMQVRADDVFVGAYGTGAKPIISMTAVTGGFDLGGGSSTTYARAVFMDLEIEGNSYDGDSRAFGSSGGFDDVLYLRCTARHVKFGWKFSSDALNGYNSGINPATDPPLVHLWEGHGAVDCAVDELFGVDNGSNGFYMAGKWMAIMGTNIDNNYLGEHGIRGSCIQNAIIAHNRISRIDDGRAFISFRATDQGQAMFPTFTYGPYVYSENTVISDNFGDGEGSPRNNVSMGIGPTNNASTGRVRNILFERNFLQGVEANITPMGVSMHMRLNLFKVDKLSVFFTSHIGLDLTHTEPEANDVHWYHNSIYGQAAATGDNAVRFFNPNEGDITGSPTYAIKNNLLYSPGGDASYLINPSLVNLAVDATNNTTTSQDQTNAYAATTPPTTALHWKPAGGSYAIDAGVDLPVWSDFLNVAMYSAGTRDMGAIQS